ncbi:MAG: hypothetical protein PHC53_03430 [Patescibacteria group bacterium]|nr:hypothetical protein [Patescibacteria group bacterium]
MQTTKARLTLFPHGPSSPETQEKLRELLFHCGADLARIVDPHLHTLDRFVKFASRFDDLVDEEGASAPIMVLTKTEPVLHRVVLDTSLLVRELTATDKSLWIVYFTEKVKEPFFEDELRSLGEFSQALDDEIPSLDQALIWKDKRTKRRYLILTPDTAKMKRIEERVRLLTLPQPAAPRLRTDLSSTTLRAVCPEEIMEEARGRDSKP